MKRYLYKVLWLATDAVLVIGACWLAYLIRFDFKVPLYYQDQLYKFLLIFFLIRLTSFYYCGFYRSIQRYFSLTDAYGLIKAVSLGTILVMVIDYFRNYGIGITIAGLFALSAVIYRLSGYDLNTLPSDRKMRKAVLGGISLISIGILVSAVWVFKGVPLTQESPVIHTWIGQLILSKDFLYDLGIPRAIIILEWILCIGLVGGVHLIPRILREVVWQYRQKNVKEVLIVGAGDAGEMVVREMRKNPGFGYLPVGFIDDNLFKRHARIHGLEVLGTRDDISRVVRDKQVDEVLIAIPSLQGSPLRELLAQCRESDVPVKTLPGISSILSGHFSVGELQTIDTSALLGREEVILSLDTVAEYLKGKKVLVTGAGGSIGSELCRQILAYNPEALIMLGRGENSIYEIENELQGDCGQTTLHSVIADARDRDKMDRVFSDYHPDVVFHAAAHKHVPLMERHLDEAVRNNVFGTLNVARSSRDHGASVFVLISTDKAVNPENVMGATKKVAELIVQELAREGKMKFVIVRFGNVIRSRGSVIPLFEKQIQNGGPVTITHPEVTRYFMSIPEAAHLVLQSGAVADSGSICVLDMGEPVRILDLARNLIRMAGLRPDEDIPIEFTGLRPGDKLYEELLTSGKNMKATRFEKIFMDEPDHVNSERLYEGLKRLEVCVKKFDRPGMISLLQELVPTYRVQRSDSVSEKRG